ncbi:MAG TPA: glycosyltransferase [Sphingomicrobium sp.]|nr:glycosyltransferase [Sphingomicrobium sp.]
MRIVDVCAFYTPFGGGVRTYVDAKLKAAARLGHEMIVIAPGERHEIAQRGAGAVVVTIPSPTLPVDRRYRYFHDQAALHAALDEWRPDHVEASSPWSSATMVGRWDGPASRSLVMHADPLAAYAYRWFGGIASTDRIDRWFDWFWRHMRGLDRLFDTIVCANRGLARRLTEGGLDGCVTIPMGVECGVFAPSLRTPRLRADALRSLGLGPDATLLLGVGRISGEKRWNMVIRAVAAAARQREVGLLLVGDGPKRPRLERLAARSGVAKLIPPITDRAALGRLLASADALVHGCEAETFCMVAAEARASGVPLIVPDRGAALDQLFPGAGLSYQAASEDALRAAVERFIGRGPELQRALAVRASAVRSMDEHFADLFAHYAGLGAAPAVRLQPDRALVAPALPQVAFARSSLRSS